METRYLLYFLVSISIPASILSASPNGGWNDAPDTQYHIQTDEGPERYFRYQTISGQYRKEKRLEDGTVIGTYGWVDPNGVLLLKDYIADNQGYRILKSKNVYVGKNSDIPSALSIVKKVPANSGILANSDTRPNVKIPSVVPSYSYTTTTPRPQVVNYEFSTPPRPQAVYEYSTPSPLGFGYKTQTRVPIVHISPNSISASTESPLKINVISTTASPDEYISSTPAPSVYITSSTPSYSPTSTPIPLAVYTTKQPQDYQVPSSTPIAIYDTPTGTPSRVQSSTPSPIAVQSPRPTPLAIINTNSLDYSQSQKYNYDKYEPNPTPYYPIRNGPTYPIDRNGNIYDGYSASNNIGNGYDPQYQYYDGVSVTNDGFRYYLPRQYHEEQNLPGDRKSGSFGYVDPFGIRRVIYYNTAPGTGFQHRKNNRYVGLNATPYDPRPYSKR